MSQNLSQNVNILRQNFATRSLLDADPARDAVAKLRIFATRGRLNVQSGGVRASRYRPDAVGGQERGLVFDRELIYAAAMFHDVGLMPSHSSPNLLFEVDGANAARDFLASHKVDLSDIEKVWTGIALHTTPGVPVFMHPVIALTTADVEMDVLGLTYDRYADAVRDAVVAAFPRSARFKEDIIQAFYDGIRHKPETTFGNGGCRTMRGRPGSATTLQ